MKLITEILEKYKDVLQEDFDAYHHHCQRVYSYACTLLLIRESKKLAIISAFHDLDIWVSQSMDYLGGSAQLLSEYVTKNDFDFVIDEMKYILKTHHKLTPVWDNAEAEAFRKADLIDLTVGLVSFNLPAVLIKEKEKEQPRLGFTKLILAKALKYAIHHPLAPFPMLRW